MPSTNVVAIIGAGIVGLAIGLELTSRFPDLSIVIVEKEAFVAGHQTSHNSGVIHSGIYYKPGSLKARLCIQGAQELLLFCSRHDIPFEVCGKLIVATQQEELPRLNDLYCRGLGNGLHNLRRLRAEEISEIEPHARGLAGIQVPGTAIVDFRRVAEKYAALITQRGGSIRLCHRVTGISRSNSLSTIETDHGKISAGVVINCAGLHSDRVSRMANAGPDLAIIPFRGEYYDLAPKKRHYLNGLLYPVPDPQFPFLGVHFTRRIGGGVEAGPNAVLALEREGYSRKSFKASDVMEYVTLPGFWRMASKHWRMSLGEYHRSLSKAAFVRALQRLMPEITSEDLVTGGSGVRAQALNKQGKLIDDFHIAYTDGMIHVSNVPSPAATASLAIARYVVDTISHNMPSAFTL